MPYLSWELTVIQCAAPPVDEVDRLEQVQRTDAGGARRARGLLKPDANEALATRLWVVKVRMRQPREGSNSVA